jgi:surfeit locus 1 family protein
MRIFGFRPALIPTLITVPAVILAIGLGTWQIDRLFWKQGLIAERESAVAADPVSLPDRFVREAHHFRRVRVTGTYLHDAEMYLAARSMRGNIGYHIVTPMRLEDGRTILVNRGWVPQARKRPELRAAGQVEGAVTITGILRAPPPAGYFTPDNEPERNIWFSVDLDAMARHAGVDTFNGLYVEVQESAHNGPYPLAGQTRIELPNNHLQYVITWYAVAIGAIVIYFLWHRRRERELREEGGDEE